MIEKYFNKIEKSITCFKHIIKNYSVEKKVYSDIQGYIKIDIYFYNDYYLKIIEIKDIEIEAKVKYCYHFMDEKKEILFRYDNADHFREIKTYPHHKHTLNNIEESEEPDIFEIITEINDILEKIKK